jgi:hypothetical protein
MIVPSKEVERAWETVTRNQQRFTPEREDTAPSMFLELDSQGGKVLAPTPLISALKIPVV